MSKTIYYLAETNADPMVIAVQGNRGYTTDPTPQGNDITTGVSLLDGNVVENLRTAYQKLAVDNELYTMQDIIADFATQCPDNFFKFNEDDFEDLVELVTLETFDFTYVREHSGMNMTDFGKYFNIPFRTVQNWELGKRKCPDYLLELMEYKLKNEKVGKYEEEH